MVNPTARINELIDKITICEDTAQVETLLDRLARITSPTILSFINAHAVNLSRADENFRRHLLEADILLRDGSGIATLFRWLKRSPGINLNGTDLIPRIADRFRGMSAALFGTQEPWLSRAATQFQAMGLEVTDICDGFQEPAVYRDRLVRRPAALVILGMGMPKQEAVASDLRSHLTDPCLLVNGGAILDFFAGRIKRAPRLVQRIGMEWSYRLWQEPRRLCRRYAIGNCRFLISALRLAWTQRRVQSDIQDRAGVYYPDG